ncbi:peptide-methionine (S)-S-oxide reductase MsrA [Hylemonella gracilis]|uniref:Peptide methionine sulfoxide reductase MsrA n=1 Tax=Hylemonella gracilis ATCC 19624 TaxID=887062 RepID=F3KST1_9BURK|nr:peptide-methionine (S)-S-oxide reductase MsrA [Hylemonella gracilis]EGI77150.1 peptide methionine sulfoxide reductase [Hylemonella gracilis ATCC 19624]
MQDTQTSDTPVTATETLVLGGGCFWCTEAIFTRVRGVIDVENGYSNGHVKQPSYEDVCTGDTGHAEVVRVVYDPAEISLQQLLGIFFSIHDPTTLNRQGNDVGPQYRSGIYTRSAEQARVAREMIADLEQGRIFSSPIVTEVQPLSNYWPAEDYHQDYFEHHPEQSYCAFVVGPKVEKFRKHFVELLKPGA